MGKESRSKVAAAVMPASPPWSGHLASVAVVARCLGDENRLRLLLALRHGQRSVSRLVEEVNLSQPLVSHHLKELRRALLVKVERRGPFVYYEMADPCLADILERLAVLADGLVKGRQGF